MFVHDFLENSANKMPEKICLICDGRRLTYTEIDEAANRLANALRANGFERGERAVILLPNSVELVVSIFAVLKAGGVFVVPNPTTKYAKLVYILNHCEASVFLSSDHQMEILEQVQRDVPSLKFVLVCPGTAIDDRQNCPLSYEAIQAQYPSDRLGKTYIDLDLACLIYTSGSTGDPKGVMSDHSNVVFATNAIIRYLENIEDDVVINVLPLSFDYGLYQLFMVFAFGGTLVLERSFAYPAAVLQRIEEEGVTGFPGVPTIFAFLLQMDLNQYDLSSLRYITNTAAALPPVHIIKLRKLFPDVRIYSMYGLTETKRTLYLPPDQLDSRPNSVGIAIPGTEVWIEDDEGKKMGPGGLGELVVRGRHVMRGYWGDPKATAERYRSGPLPGERVCYTGDLFRMDEDGYFYFVGRKDDIIKSRGEKVAPKEIENVLYGLEGVTEAAVIGVPDPILGEAIKAYVVLDDSHLSASDILAHCRANLEDFMLPKYVEIRDVLPKSASGKILKTNLKNHEGV